MEIFFCEKCGKRLSDLDVQRGDAVAVSDEEIYCKDCLPETPKSKKSTSTRARAVAGPPHRQTGFVRAASEETAGGRRDSRRLQQTSAVGGGLSPGFYALAAIIALVAAVVAAFLFFGSGSGKRPAGPDRDRPSSTAERPVERPAPRTPPESPPPEQPPAAGDSSGAEGAATAARDFREEGAQHMVDDIRKRWEAGTLDRLGAHEQIALLIKRYPGTKAVDEAKKLKATIPEPEPGAGMWYVVAGFPNADRRGGFAAVYPPEEKPDRIDPKAVYDLPDGSKVSWQGVQENSPTLDLTKVSKTPNIVYYAFAWLYSAADQEATLCTNSDDGIKAWLNGELFVAEDVDRGVDVDPDKQTKVKLRKGLNPVLVKVLQGGGAAGLRLYVKDNSAEVLRTTNDKAGR